MKNLICEPKRVKEVYKDIPSQDGFNSVLEDDEIVVVTDTQWKSSDFIEKVEDGVIFNSSKGKILFTNEMLEKVEAL
tara:strand:- start:1124 stop:1354 length:231 start_codon:yes stop_codon:yes gene_type:complete